MDSFPFAAKVDQVIEQVGFDLSERPQPVRDVAQQTRLATRTVRVLNADTSTKSGRGSFGEIGARQPLTGEKVGKMRFNPSVNGLNYLRRS